MFSLNGLPPGNLLSLRDLYEIKFELTYKERASMSPDGSRSGTLLNGSSVLFEVSLQGALRLN